MTTQRDTEDLADAQTQSPPGETVAAAAGRTGRFASLGQGLQQMLAFGTLIALVLIGWFWPTTEPTPIHHQAVSGEQPGPPPPVESSSLSEAG